MSDTTELNKSTNLSFDGKEIDLPVIHGSYDETAIDISALRKNTGLITIDPGYKNTGSTKSAITFIDGEAGVLLHRGYPIEQLAEKASFPEVMFLLLNGELPNADELADINGKLNEFNTVPAEIKQILEAMPQGGHPMAMMTTVLAALPSFYPKSIDSWSDEDVRWETIYRLLGHMPALVAYIYRRSQGLPFIDPKPSLGYIDNFLHMMFGEVDEVVSDALDTLLILHADHEQNCSASTVRLSGSSHVNLFAAVAAGNASLWGPLHGGANQKVLEMLENIRQAGGDKDLYISKAKDKSDPFRLMGFGHRVYKNYDPRAKVIKKYVDIVLERLQLEDPIVDLAVGLEQAALSDEYFSKRKLFPNVDFYSGIIYKALNIPVEMFTVMFAFGRMPGWIAQWKELREAGEPIGRPRQVYTGYKQRDYVALENR